MSDAAPPSIVHRVTRTLIGFAVVWSLLVSLVVWYQVGHEVDELMDQGLRESADILQGVLERAHERLDDRPSDAGSTHEAHLVWQLLHSPEHTLDDRANAAPTEPLLTPARLDALRLGSTAQQAIVQTSTDGRWRVLALRIEPQHEPNPALNPHLLLVAAPTRERDEARTGSVLATLVSTALLGILMTIVLGWQIRRELHPLLSFSREVAHHDPLRSDAPLPPADRAELLPIAQAIDVFGARLARRVSAERAFAAHAAHALRTPLAGVDTQLALAIREAPPALRERLRTARIATTRLSHVVPALLTLFRTGTEPRLRPVWLEALVPPLPGDTLTLQVAQHEALTADPDLLAACLFNLIDNARQHGATTLTLQAGQEGSIQFLLVEDNGRGCTPEVRQQLEAVLQAITPASSGETPTGLGLLLADRVMHAHGGRLSLPGRERGFCVRLDWPSPEHSSET